MERMLLILCALVLLVAPVSAREEGATGPRIALALDNNRVEVTARFTGQQLLLFGVVRGAIEGDDVIVTLTGPDEELMMTRKVLTGPIWVNAKPLELQGAPSFYALASTRELENIAPPDAQLRANLGLARLPLRAVGDQASAAAAQIGEYRRALIRLRSRSGLFRANEDGVTLLGEGLFRAGVYLPAGSPTGEYRARALLFRNGRLIAETNQPLTVERAGIDRLVYETAHQHSFLYGMLAVVFAVLSGWLAATIAARI